MVPHRRDAHRHPVAHVLGQQLEPPLELHGVEQVGLLDQELVRELVADVAVLQRPAGRRRVVRRHGPVERAAAVPAAASLDVAGTRSMASAHIDSQWRWLNSPNPW